MSVGRPDPNALKVITPDVYNQNLAQIAKAKATLEAFEKMNETGKSNYEKILEQEEQELEQKIQEGLLARQQLEQLRQRKAIGLLEDAGGSSRIEEVGNANPDPRRYDHTQHPQHPHNPVSVGLPVQNTFTSHSQANLPPTNYPNYNGQAYPPYNQYNAYPQPQAPQAPYVRPYPLGQPVRPTSSTSYSGVLPYYPTQSQTSQGSNVHQQYHPPPIASQTNNVRANTRSVNQSQRSQAQSVPNVQPHQHNVHPHQPHHPPNQANPYYRDMTVTNQTIPPATQVPTTAPHIQQQPFPQTQQKQHKPPINTGAPDPVAARNAVTSPTTQTSVANSTNPSNMPTLTHSGSSQRPSMTSTSRPGRPETSSNNATVDQTMGKDPSLSIPTAPTSGQVNLFKSYFGAWGSRVPPRAEYTGDITCGRYSIKCSKHPDGSIRFLVKLPTGVVHILASSFLDGLLSTATRPIDHTPFQQQEADSQVVNQPLPNAQGSTSNGLPPTTEHTYSTQTQISIPSFKTPVRAAQLERRVGTITSPKQADKKRIAQSVLFALGKRRREFDSVSDAESHTSKKKAMDKSADEKLKTSPAISEPTKGDNLAATTSQNSAVPTSSTAPIQQPKLTNETTPLPQSTQPSTQTPQILSPQVAQASTSAFIPSAPTGPNSTLSMSLPPRPSTQSESVDTAPATPQLQAIPHVRRSLLPASLAPTSLPPSISQTAGSSATINKLDHVSIPTPSSSEESASTKLPPSTSGSASIPTKDLIPTITYMKSRSSRQSSEPVASSSKLAPAKEPLFLPSSPSAESDDRLGLWGSENGGYFQELPGEDSTPKTAKAKEARAQGRVNNAYVLVPPAPEYVVRYRQQQKQKQKKMESGQLSSSSGTLRRKGTRADSSVSTSVAREEDFSHSLESCQPSSIEENEREAIALACSRLQVAPCRWDGCDAEMNSVEALICHLEVHKQVASQHAKTFMCRWTQCGQQGIKAEDVHMEKHALLPLRCAYAGCDDSFRSEGQLLRHFRTKHSDDELKPSAKPTAPSTLPDPPPIPGVVPSYLIVTSLAGRQLITKERHSILSQQILRNMTYSDEQTVPSKQRTRKNARPTTRPNSPAATAHLTNDYHFLENNNSARSSTYFSKACDLDHADLDRETVSKIVDQGVVLLGSDVSEQMDGDDEDNDDSLLVPSSPLFSPLQQRVSHGEIKVESGWEEEPSYGGSASRRDEHSSDEDAAVETMLTDMTSTRTSTS